MFCPACGKDTNPFSEMDVTADHAMPRPVKKCSTCRAPYPKANGRPTTATTTAPAAAAMPAAASVLIEQPPPKPAPQRPEVAPVARPAAPAPASRLDVPSHDYAAMARDELRALVDAERQIQARKAYLTRLLAAIEPTTPAEATN